MQHVFIIGSRGLPAQYGGFETFVAELVQNQTSAAIKYHVACLDDQKNQVHFDYCGADCFTIKVPNLGPAKVIAYDMLAIHYALKMVKMESIKQPIFYILGNTIGGFIQYFANQIHRAGGQLLVNPDGLEWRRSKWSKPIQRYLKYAERKMCQSADLIVSDNQGIEDYLLLEYPKTVSQVIAYGTDIAEVNANAANHALEEWYQQFQLSPGDYYLVVGRFVPENNYETIIRSFMASKVKKDLVIITNYQDSAYYQELKNKTQFQKDSRIKFVGTVYQKDLLRLIRQQAFAYIHGHEVGGTNPGLLEAMWDSPLNLVLAVSFNQKVALDSAIYFTPANLTSIIESTEQNASMQKLKFKSLAQAIILENYTWDKIVAQYEELFLK
ncbi:MULTISPECIES: beta 1-4 rhamnosyltransferase Cps2T [unclassified Enterococcus]|uniref:beta 1-4 rhamnosyltransferase Cps2T n=1 Tax=unclassified Enterococcus TaxID=2608891 RepID=UPI0015537CED|nr:MULTISPECIES: DUF1972 domain-containing protein [unclassified Enterococcus]MBS7577871.1 DUF1972 domain-containing protein [Enterococcus sp. MMGLQ5-2]MBS7585131.1 DUF1972 domain-containing protein [Enterococcus sp. MMGLQ5-1]NPD12987.1 DUF1972 domain-containing protein [Enterococcus sp. MMGLQ5-1]NPD37701.1 DUF1972 domain-containing protein [Enterococcus sp. MMGLQ5-2]